jgi:hypothetical protein
VVLDVEQVQLLGSFNVGMFHVFARLEKEKPAGGRVL